MTARRAIVAAALPLALGGCIAATAIAYGAHTADPVNQVILAERQFALAAQNDGQWTAFRAAAAPDAIMFVPQPTAAQTFLAGRADPPRAVSWQVHRVYVSCDGRLAATTGAAQWPGGSHGRFTTIWRKQPDGHWRWIADEGGTVAVPLTAPARVAHRRARCGGRSGEALALIVNPGTVTGGGAANDGSLVWSYAVRPDGSRDMLVQLRDNAAFTRVIDDHEGAR